MGRQKKPKRLSVLGNFTKYVSFSVLGMIGLSCYILADTYFIALGMGADGLTALNLAIPVYSFMNGLSLMIGIGCATRYSILMGQGEKEKANGVFTHGFVYAAILAVVFFLAGLLFSNQIASLLGAHGHIQTMAVGYLKTFLLMAPFFFMNNLMNSFVRNDGSPNLGMAAMLLGSLTNIILDYIFIFPLQMGMMGAALATGIAPIVGLMVTSIHILKKKNRFKLVKVKLKIKKFMDISSLGISSLITEFAVGMVMIIFNLLILELTGNVGVAAYGVVANIGIVVISIFTGVSQGAQPLLSSDYGKRNTKNLFKVYRYAVITAVSAAAIVYVAVFFFAEPITLLFNTQGNAQLTPIAVEGMKIYFLAFLFSSVNIISSSFLSAVEQAGKSFLISLSRGLVFVVPLAFLLSWAFGMTGIWLTQPVAEVLTAGLSVVMILLFKRKVKSSAAHS